MSKRKPARRSSDHCYVIALGSNRSQHGHETPRQILGRAMAELAKCVGPIVAQSDCISTEPLGPSRRRYVNAAVVLSTALPPAGLLDVLKQIEVAFGRRKGRKWSARTLDLDIILWSGGAWHSDQPYLSIPHTAFRERDFVLSPSRQIAAHWIDPVTGFSVAQLAYRQKRPKPLDRTPARH